jgi:hypothetical protein
MLTRITGAVARRGALGLIGPARRLRAGRGRRAVARACLAVAVSAALTLAGSAGPALATASRRVEVAAGLVMRTGGCSQAGKQGPGQPRI